MIRLAAAGLLLCGATSCTDRYIDYNKNPHEPGQEDMGTDWYLVRSLALNLQDLMMPEQENFSQYVDCLMAGNFSGYVADSNIGTGWSGRYATFNPSDAWTKIPFNDFYAKFYPDYFNLKNQSDDELFLALAELYRIAVMLRVTDTYGPIPYSKVGAGNAIKSPYDSQKEVYTRMFADLDNVIATLGKYANQSFSANADRIYDGNTKAWCKFANSLKLRMAMRVVYADAELAQTKAEQAVNSEYGVMTTADDGAYRKVADHNPWERFMVLWSDARVAADLTCYMNGYADPRREAYYGKSTFASVSGGTYRGEEKYAGLRRGILQGQYNSWSQGSSCMKVGTGDDIVVFRASEVFFLRAEGALRGWDMGGSAKDLYEAGIRTSFQEHGVDNGVDQYLAGTTKAETFIDPLKGLNGQPYDYSGTTGSTAVVAWQGGDFEQSLEQIITQKWIANFPNGMEAWSEYRRTGYPRLMPMAANASTGGVVDDTEGARRMPYPADEYRENKENVEAAVETLAKEASTKKGDTMGTHVWWDCK
jgi:hypothetical protein